MSKISISDLRLSLDIGDKSASSGTAIPPFTPPDSSGTSAKRVPAENSPANDRKASAAIPALRDFTRQAASGSTIKNPYIKGKFTEVYLENARQPRPRNAGKIQPTATQLKSVLGKLQQKGINASFNGNILKRLNIQEGERFKYSPWDMLVDLKETVTEAETSGKPAGRQYSLTATDFFGRFDGYCGTSGEISHIETFIVTPHGAALQVGPLIWSRFLMNQRLTAIGEGRPHIRVYTADLSAFIKANVYDTVTPQGLYLRRPEGSIITDKEPFPSPLSIGNLGTCGTLGNRWIKGLLENDGRRLSCTLLVDLPGEGTGFFLPPPVCLRYSDSDRYIKIAFAMTSEKLHEVVEHNGERYEVTTIAGVFSLEIPVRNAANGRRIGKDELFDILALWRSLYDQERKWREARMVRGLSHALRSKTAKQAEINFFSD